jgi:predicted lysophospholipase L1 biosynthesis ABC-type transport system permease subunit
MPLILLKNLRSRAILHLWVKDARAEFTVYIPIHIAALVSLFLLNLLSTRAHFLIASIFSSFVILIFANSGSGTSTTIISSSSES